MVKPFDRLDDGRHSGGTFVVLTRIRVEESEEDERASKDFSIFGSSLTAKLQTHGSLC
jgi:hypothetical protein